MHRCPLSMHFSMHHSKKRVTHPIPRFNTHLEGFALPLLHALGAALLSFLNLRGFNIFQSSCESHATKTARKTNYSSFTFTRIKIPPQTGLPSMFDRTIINIFLSLSSSLPSLVSRSFSFFLPILFVLAGPRKPRPMSCCGRAITAKQALAIAYIIIMRLSLCEMF